MTTSTQKQQEIIYATKAGELLQNNWLVEASPDETNWPDLLVTQGSVKFGLEVREIYLDECKKGSSKKALEVQNSKTIRNLASSYYEQKSVPLIVKFINKIPEENDLLHFLGEKVSQLQVWEQGRFKTSNQCTVSITRLPDQFHNYMRWPFITDRVGWVSEMDKSTLQRVIAQKSKKLEKYQKQILDVRLLIVSDKTFNSGKAQILRELKCKTHGFLSVYYLSFPEAIWEIGS